MAESTPQAFNVQKHPPPSPDERKEPPPLPDRFIFPSTLPTPPFINVDGIPNFRDMGGYLTAASYLTTPSLSTTPPTPTMVRRNLLYRCAHPQLLTPTGNTTLTHTLGIKHIFDLRSAPEVKKLSSTLPHLSQTDAPANPHSSALQPQGLTRHFTPVYIEEDYGPVALATKLKWYTSAQTKSPVLPHAYSEGFVNAYRDIATHATRAQGGKKAAYPTILRQILAHPSEPIIFHCTAGKDRTGVLAALLLRLAGVDDDTIAWEYALTEPGLGSWRRLFIERIARGGLGQAGARNKDVAEAQPTPEASSNANTNGEPKMKMTHSEAARIVGSRAGNIRAFLTLVVDGEFGGVEKYFTEMCGLSKQEVDALRETLVVPVTEVEDVVMVRGIEGWTPEGGVWDDDVVSGEVNGGLGLDLSAGREREEKVMVG